MQTQTVTVWWSPEARAVEGGKSYRGQTHGGGGHTVHCIGRVSQKCAPENYTISLTSVTPVQLIK